MLPKLTAEKQKKMDNFILHRMNKEGPMNQTSRVSSSPTINPYRTPTSLHPPPTTNIPTPAPFPKRLRRIQWYRRFSLRARHLRVLVVQPNDNISSSSGNRKNSSGRKRADSGSGSVAGGGGTGSGDGSTSSPDEAFVTRWIIVTDKRAMYAQEEPEWGLDKEKVKTLDLVR